MVFDVDDEFIAACHSAESRHRVEMKGWTPALTKSTSEPDRSYLYEIRALATKQY